MKEVAKLQIKDRTELFQSTAIYMGMYWVYGPGKSDITIIGLEPHT